MRKIKNKNNGFIAIASLLIIATISIILASGMLKDGVDNASLSLSSIYYENARMNAMICLEDTLMRIKREDQFSENPDYTLNENENCSGNIEWQTPEKTGPGITETTANLTVTGTAWNFSRRFDYDLNIKKHDINHVDGSVEYTNNIHIISVKEVAST